MGLSNAERQRRYIGKLKHRASVDVEGLKARIAELEAQAAAGSQTMSIGKFDLPKSNVEEAFGELEAALARARVRIRALTTRNRNLEAQIRDETRWSSSTERRVMPHKTYIKLMQALHPDTVWESEAEKTAAQGEACKLLTAWATAAKDRRR